MKHGAQRAAAVILIVLAALAGGCKDRTVRFDHLETLPGFEIELPKGMAAKRADHAGGGQIMEARPSMVLMLAWSNGRVSQDDLPTFARTTMETLAAELGVGTTDELPFEIAAPDYGMAMAARTDKGADLLMTTVQCDRANVTVWIMSMVPGDRAAALRFHERFRSTLRCRDDVAPLSPAAALPSVTMGDDLGYVPGSDPPMYVSTRGPRWTITIGDTSIKAVMARPDMVARMFAGFGLTITSQEPVTYGGHGDWTVRHLTGTLDGEEAHLTLALLQCAKDLTYMVVYADIFAFDETPSPSALDRVACPTSPVDPATLPTAAARFTAACDGGDAKACMVFALLIEEDPSLFPDHDSKELRARACELGIDGMCATDP